MIYLKDKKCAKYSLHRRRGKMFPNVLLLVMWLASIDIVAGVFQCPTGLTQNCSCGETIDWVDEAWQTLSFVNCSSARLERIPDLSPLKGVKVDRIILCDNNIRHIESNELKHLDVRELVLSKNSLKKLKPETFKHIRSKIERLDLSEIKLRIDEGLQFLHGMVKLKSLDLGYNVLSRASKYNVLPPGLFAQLNLTSLKTLVIPALQMTRLEEGIFEGIESIEQLDISYNFLAELPTELRKLTNLRKLKLYSNEIIVLPNDSFAGLTRLKTLLIGANDLDTIEVGAFNDLENSLEVLNLYLNHLPAVPTEAIAPLKKLRMLSLVKNDIVSIENGSFAGEYQLEQLELDENPKLVFKDEGAFHGIEESLTTLYIRGLNLTKLPLEILSRLPNLIFLDATANQISSIDADFFRGLDLKEIYLMWNKIHHVDPRAFRNFRKGVTLDLRENRITNISFILDVKPCTFWSLDLSQNSIECDCVLEEVLHSGLVGWSIAGQCYSLTDGVAQWHRLKDRNLRARLEKSCNVTSPYAVCNQTSGAISARLLANPCQILALFIVILMCINTFTH